MKKVSIIKNNEVVQFVNFEDKIVMQEWIDMLAADHSWGKPAYDEVIYEEGSIEVILETIHHDAEYTIVIEDVTVAIEKRDSLEEKRIKGANARKACLDAIDVISGYNIDRELTAEQITEMQNTFGSIQSALMTNRPSSAKALISQIVPDGTLVSVSMKEDILEVLKEY